MNQQSVFVHDETLIFHKNGSPIEFQMGSPDWYCWVETASTFAFHSPEGSFTAYQEQAGNRRGGCYWKACCQRGGKLSSVYLGKAERLTPQRLKAAATLLAHEEDEERWQQGPEVVTSEPSPIITAPAIP